MKRIVLDQGLPVTGSTLLRESGRDAVHVREIGMADASDEQILSYGSSESRVVVTLDRDFPKILALTGAVQPSVVLLRQQRLRAPQLATILAEVWKSYEDLIDHGCVVTVGAESSRIRPLPLR